MAEGPSRARDRALGEIVKRDDDITDEAIEDILTAILKRFVPKQRKSRPQEFKPASDDPISLLLADEEPEDRPLRGVVKLSNKKEPGAPSRREAETASAGSGKES